MRDEPLKTFHKVSCLCGATVRVDPLSVDRRVTCPNCNSTFDFVVTVDPGRKKSRLSLVLPRAAMRTAGESLGMKPAKTPAKAEAPPPEPKPEPRPAARAPAPAPKTVTKVTRKPSGKTISVLMGHCECGAAFPLEDTGELTTMQSCPQCNLIYHVVFKIESGTKQKSAMIVAEKPKPRPTRAAPPAKPGDVTDFFTPGGRKGRTRVTKTSPPPKAPVDIPPGAQGVPCSCGELFIVRRRDVGQAMTCGGCGRAASFEEARDPQSLAPILRIKTDRKF